MSESLDSRSNGRFGSLDFGLRFLKFCSGSVTHSSVVIGRALKARQRSNPKHALRFQRPKAQDQRSKTVKYPNLLLSRDNQDSGVNVYVRIPDTFTGLPDNFVGVNFACLAAATAAACNNG